MKASRGQLTACGCDPPPSLSDHPENAGRARLRILDPDEGCAEHCQHDNPTIGQKFWRTGLPIASASINLRCRIHPSTS
jgi:hypothetical protein